jgi:hypothetical protein
MGSSRLGVGRTADDQQKKKNIGESKEVQTGWSDSGQVGQNLLRKAVAQKGLFILPMMMMVVMKMKAIY